MSQPINPEGFFIRYKWQAVEDWQESIAIYKKGNKSFTVVGKNLPDDKSYLYKFWGEWDTHPKYGLQFKATYHELIVDRNKLSLIRYLSSDKFNGIGKATAKRIIDYFDENVLDILDKNIELIYNVPKLNAKKQQRFIEQYQNNRNSILRDVIITLSKYDISHKQATDAFQYFGNENIWDIINQKPYRLSEISGISFKKADEIGPKTKDYELDPDRLFAGIRYVLDNNIKNGTIYLNGQNIKMSPSGSIGLPRSIFENVAFSLLYQSYLTKTDLEQYICTLINDQQIIEYIIHQKSYIFPTSYFFKETTIATNLIRLCSPTTRIRITKRDIAKVEKYLSNKYHTNFIFSDEQTQAIKNAFAYGLSLIIGPPGTGKTTVIEGISLLYQWKVTKDPLNRRFCAPSGKAAARITESTGEQGMTIHKAFGIETQQYGCGFGKTEDFYNKLIVIDEISMLDIDIASFILTKIKDGCYVVLCGDDQQLPSVKNGAVLRDMIESDVVPKTELKQVYRQDNESVLYENMVRMRRGETELLESDDFHIIECENASEVEEKMIQMYDKKITFYLSNPQYGKRKDRLRVLMLSPNKEGYAGIHRLNKLAQEKTNPLFHKKQITSKNLDSKDKETILFRQHDLVMHLKNHFTDHSNFVVNGDWGFIDEINKDEDDMLVLTTQYDDNRTWEYDEKTLQEELTHAYAMTVHKSQGSQGDCVIICCHKDMMPLFKIRNILYTGITRAKKEVYIFGDKETISKSILNTEVNKRITTLKYLLQDYMNEM